jgi:hypothetical protein
VAVALSCAVKAAASSDAIRSGGLSMSVPRAVLVATSDVVLFEPQAVSKMTATAE